jgi:hypothetical protein
MRAPESTRQIRKTSAGRRLLYQINSGPFWIYGILTFILAFSLSGFWFQSVTTRLLLSFPLALLAAFTLPCLVHALFWKRWRNVWMDSYVGGAFLVAILLVGYARDVRDGRDEALSRLASRTLTAALAGLLAYASNRKRTTKNGIHQDDTYPENSGRNEG